MASLLIATVYADEELSNFCSSQCLLKYRPDDAVGTKAYNLASSKGCAKASEMGPQFRKECSKSFQNAMLHGCSIACSERKYGNALANNEPVNKVRLNCLKLPSKPQKDACNAGFIEGVKYAEIVGGQIRHSFEKLCEDLSTQEAKSPVLETPTIQTVEDPQAVEQIISPEESKERINADEEQIKQDEEIQMGSIEEAKRVLRS